MRPRFIRASIPSMPVVFVYLCGTPENPAETEREGEGEGIKRKGEETRKNKESEKGGLSRERKERGRREEPMASQGVLPFRYEGAGG